MILNKIIKMMAVIWFVLFCSLIIDKQLRIGRADRKAEIASIIKMREAKTRSDKRESLMSEKKKSKIIDTTERTSNEQTVQ